MQREDNRQLYQECTPVRNGNYAADYCCNRLYIYSQKLPSLLQPSIHIQLETSIIVATLYTFTVETSIFVATLYIYNQKLLSSLKPSIHIQLITSIIVATVYTHIARNFHHCCNPLYIYSQKLPSLLQPSINIQLETSIIVATLDIHIQLKTSIIVVTLYTYTVRNFNHC